jgi:hypothetical protein
MGLETTCASSCACGASVLGNHLPSGIVLGRLVALRYQGLNETSFQLAELLLQGEGRLSSWALGVWCFLLAWRRLVLDVNYMSSFCLVFFHF